MRKASLTKPTFADAENTVYEETVQKKTVIGYQSGYMDVAASDGAAFENNTFSATNADKYTLTFKITNNNFTWSDGGAAAPDVGQPDFTLTWTIEKAENAVVKENGTSFVRTEYKGWAFGNEPTDPDTLGVHAKYDDGQLTAEYKYYAASDTGFSTPLTMTEKSNVGAYILRVIIPAGDNTLEAHFDFAFSIVQNSSTIQGTAEIGDPVLAGKDEWCYKDPLENHELTYRVTVGKADITGAAVVTYYKRTEGSPTTIKRDDLATAPAGEYYVTIVVAETPNYTRLPFLPLNAPMFIKQVLHGTPGSRQRAAKNTAARRGRSPTITKIPRRWAPIGRRSRWSILPISHGTGTFTVQLSTATRFPTSF